MARNEEANRYEDLLDLLDSLVDEALKLPLSGGRCVVDEEKVHDIVSQLRTKTPQEILKARKIVEDRTKILDDAKSEAESIIKKAEARAKDIVNNDDLAKQASQHAEELIATANLKSREIIGAAKNYSENMLKRTEDTLAQNMAEIRKTRQNLKNASVSNVLKKPSERRFEKVDTDTEE
ncbi:MAG: ATPase [Clostridia bacterium]|nr:ATPase [Clostridia bacterium]